YAVETAHGHGPRGGMFRRGAISSRGRSLLDIGAVPHAAHVIALHTIRSAVLHHRLIARSPAKCAVTGDASAGGVRREKAALSSGCKSHPATAPAGSNRSSYGGDEIAEAFGMRVRIGDSRGGQAVKRGN